MIFSVTSQCINDFAQLIANKDSYKFKYQPITALCGQIQARCR